jgi:hypothetical protein
MITVTSASIDQPLHIAHHHAAAESFPPEDKMATRMMLGGIAP